MDQIMKVTDGVILVEGTTEIYVVKISKLNFEPKVGDYMYHEMTKDGIVYKQFRGDTSPFALKPKRSNHRQKNLLFFYIMDNEQSLNNRTQSHMTERPNDISERLTTDYIRLYHDKTKEIGYREIRTLFENALWHYYNYKQEDPTTHHQAYEALLVDLKKHLNKLDNKMSQLAFLRYRIKQRTKDFPKFY